MPPAVFGGLLSARLDLSARQPAGKALLASAAAVCTYYLSWLLSLPLHASFPRLASLYPPKESAAALVTALGRATALATVVYCVWVFVAAAIVRDDEHKGPAELAEEKRRKQGSKKRA